MGKSWDFSRFRAPRGLANGDHRSKKKSLEESRIFSEFRAPKRARPWKPAEQTQIVGEILVFFSKFRAPPRARPWRPAKQKEILRYHSNPDHKLTVRNYLGKGFFCWENLGIFLDSVRPEGSPMETTKAKRNRWRNLGFFPNSVRLRGLAHGNQQSKHKSLEKSCFFFQNTVRPPGLAHGGQQSKKKF